MSTPAPNEGTPYSQPHRLAGRASDTLCKMSNRLANELTADDLAELRRSIIQALAALEGDSLASAIRNEDLTHILARVNVVDAKATALLVSAEYLCHLAADMRRQVADLRDTIEPSEDENL